MSLPLSLASIDRDLHNSGIYVELLLGTENEYYTPIVKALSVGAPRYLGDSNGWSIPSGVTRLANGTWENSLGTTMILTGTTDIHHGQLTQQRFWEISAKRLLV